MDLEVGDAVVKKEGYHFPGTVRAIFDTEDGQPRIVVQLAFFKMLHIYRPDQVEPCKPSMLIMIDNCLRQIVSR